MAHTAGQTYPIPWKIAHTTADITHRIKPIPAASRRRNLASFMALRSMDGSALFFPLTASRMNIIPAIPEASQTIINKIRVLVFCSIRSPTATFIHKTLTADPARSAGLNAKRSRPWTVQHPGIRRGSSLSPSLFLFIRDIGHIPS